MFGSGACSYAIDSKVRCMEALLGDKENARFLVGTTSLLQPNQIHVLDYNSTVNEVSVKHVYVHEAQVLDLAPSPFAKDLLVTCGKRKGEAVAAALWKMENMDDDNASEGDSAPKPLVAVAELPQQKLPVSKVAWNTGDEHGSAVLASAHGRSLRTWSLENNELVGQDKLELDLSLASGSLGALRWDPHHTNYISYTLGSSIQTWDTRSKNVAFAIEDAHMQTTLDIDYNPNKPHCVVSGGDDGKMKFWDLRHARKPLLTLSAHMHWVWNVRYNRFHDQLVLSSSSDSTLALWRVSSISSAPIVELDEQDFMSESASGADVVDTKIKTYEEHEDSVYAVAWGVGDSWIFGSVSYDGRFCVNQVPSTEKYKILL
ncbi:Wd repeat protein tssc1, wd repeat superfamily, partial [Globisporangium splendens]